MRTHIELDEAGTRKPIAIKGDLTSLENMVILWDDNTYTRMVVEHGYEHGEVVYKQYADPCTEALNWGVCTQKDVEAQIENEILAMSVARVAKSDKARAKRLAKYEELQKEFGV